MIRCPLFVLILHITFSFAYITFVFPPSQPHIYVGYLWKNFPKVYLRPLLQVITDGNNVASRTLCGVDVLASDFANTPFYTQITDHQYGFVDILVNTSRYNELILDKSKVFQLQAYDCNVPPNKSPKVPIHIQLVTHDGPFFPLPMYNFTVHGKSHVGSVVGQVQAIKPMRDDEHDMYAAICGYQLGSQDLPFAIDTYGVIRVQRKLSPRPTHRPYVFQAIVEDCYRPKPRRAIVDVVVNQIAHECQIGWKGLPTYLESHGLDNKPERLFESTKLQLELCTTPCTVPKLEARLELQSALAGYALKTADADTCLHDPEHLTRQRLLCELHPTTLTHLLPDPDEDIASQLVNPSLGHPPRLIAPVRVWRFDSSARTVWPVDPNYLNGDQHINPFDSDFTIAFWLRRYAPSWHTSHATTTLPEEEVVFCHQDRHESNWRFMSVSFENCRLIVRLLASLQSGPSTFDTQPREPTVWVFGPLPEEYCTLNARDINGWHHYAITFSRNPWGVTTDLVSLLVDGQDLGLSGEPTETHLAAVPPYVPHERRAQPYVTIGGCFDPTTQLIKQHLNADLTGLTLLLGRTEAPSNLRCVAQCGESLIVPNVMKYLRSDVSVSLESNAITVSAQNVSHLVDVVQAIAYVRPEAGVSPNYTPHATQARLLNLTTLYSCDTTLDVSRAEIKFFVFPRATPPKHDINMAGALNSKSQSVWLRENTDTYSRSHIAQVDMERKAWLASVSTNPLNTPPVLLIEGSDIVITEPPIGSPGIQLFSDIRFTLPEEVEGVKNPVAAAVVPLDSCIVWIASSGDPRYPVNEPGLRESEGERIDWSVEQVVSLGLSGTNDKHGIQVHGLRPAGDYETLLKTLHYWPPKSMRVSTEDNPRDAIGSEEVKYFAKVGIICTMDSGKKATPQFFVNVIIESSNDAAIDLSSEEALQNLSPENDVPQPNYAHSNQERRRMYGGLRALKSGENDVSLRLLEDGTSGKRKHLVAVGLSVTTVVVLLAISLIIVIYVKTRSNAKTVSKPPGKRRRFPTQPADFGGSSLKHDPTLRLTANPMGELEYTGIGTVHEDLYGSSRNLAQSPHIFSPPVTQLEHLNGSLWTSARLAGLEEFEEDYMDDDCFDASQPDSVHAPATTEVYRSETYGADVHDWIDDNHDRQNYATEKHSSKVIGSYASAEVKHSVVNV